MKNSYSVILSLFRTEKGTNILPLNKYLFKVARKANKIQIKKAVEDIYNVKVADVNSISMRGKKRRLRYKEGKTSDWKKAVVTLKEGQTIDLK